jgi:phosphatidate cytidylyltransferase
VRGQQPRRGRSDLAARLLAAVPAVGFALLIVGFGGPVFAGGLIVLGVLALNELYALMARVRPVNLAGFLTIIALVVVALYRNPSDLLIVLAASFPVTFLVAVSRARLRYVAWGIAVTLFGALWIGLPLAHAMLLRELEHGDGLMIDVLLATFLGDTAAYLGGRLWGRTPLVPDISPNKTLEGLLAGVVGATATLWVAGLYQDWLSGIDAVVLGLCVAVAAPVGDLFESLVKRDLGVKDTGRVFGAHGGVLDRLDAVFFTVVVGYYVARGMGFA